MEFKVQSSKQGKEGNYVLILNIFYEENYIPFTNMYAPNNIDKYRKHKQVEM